MQQARPAARTAVRPPPTPTSTSWEPPPPVSVAGGVRHPPVSATTTTVGTTSATAGAAGGVRDQPIRLHDNNEQYQLHSTRADLYAIIQTTEALEGAWRRGSVSEAAYVQAVRTLIAQFKSTADLLSDQMPNPEDFWAQCGLSAQAARIRLCRERVPGTHVGLEGGAAGAGAGTSTAAAVAPAPAGPSAAAEATATEERQQALKRVATSTAVAGAGVVQAGALLNCCERFLTALDSVHLQMTAVDQVYPQLLQVAESLDRVTSVPATFDGKATLAKWLTKLKTLPATYQLNEDEVRQVTYDLNMTYRDFRAAVGA